VEDAYDDYDPTRAGRYIEEFVTEQLSNWYVRLSRRRFWKGELNNDKKAAYETLYRCLKTVCELMAPIAPFFSDWLYRSLHSHQNNAQLSVHLTQWPKSDKNRIYLNLEKSMDLSQRICSLVLSLRKKEKIKVRQPLQKILVPADNSDVQTNILQMSELICSEVNVKEIEIVSANHPNLVKQIKPNFKSLGKKLGGDMKAMAAEIQQFSQANIRELEASGTHVVAVNGTEYTLTLEDVEISTQDMPGWLVATENGITVALDITVTDELLNEGIAREFVNRIQNMRKESNYELTDKINVYFNGNDALLSSVNQFNAYICGEVLAQSIVFQNFTTENPVDVYENPVNIRIEKA
jgi:isoleucyl-tRNA synthetase